MFGGMFDAQWSKIRGQPVIIILKIFQKKRAKKLKLGETRFKIDNWVVKTLLMMKI